PPPPASSRRPMPARLHAALHLHAVFPALGVLAARDPAFADILAAPDTAVTLQAPGLVPARIARAGGQLRVTRQARPDDLRLLFPTCGQLVRACSHRFALALPVAGWTRLGSGRRLLETAGARLETVFSDSAAARSDAAFHRLNVTATLTVS